MQKFDNIYKKLNTEQQQAVDTIDGPLLVLAGPGTGKTQLLSARVANILRKTDTDPSNIVCLTFTVNAANNMRERLRSMIGSSANFVVIKTFHSLAADIIANHPERFYAGAVLNPVSELAAEEMIQSIFETLPHDNPLASKYDDRYTHLGNALGAIGRTKDAGLSPDKLRSALSQHSRDIEALEPKLVQLLSKTLSHKNLEALASDCDNLASSTKSDLATAIARLVNQSVGSDLPTGKTTQTGKLKSKLVGNKDGKKSMVRERNANAWWVALAGVYERYQEMLYKRGYMDYSDMLLGVIGALERDSDLRLDLQESTQYLLIDEFQDSNEAQIQMMHLLVDNPLIDKPNIMVVGDPNQTIYGFNGAMLDNTTDFQQFYNDNLATVDLTRNYRSTQVILDDARSVITPYSSFHSDLIAEAKPDKSTVAYTKCATEADQAVRLCKNIASLLKSDNSATIAILARKHSSLSYLTRYLSQSGITVNYEHSIDIRNTSCNQLIITVLSLIQAITVGDRQACDYQLSLLLHNPVFSINSVTLWQIALESNRTNNWIVVAGKHADTAPIVKWVQGLTQVASSQQIGVLVEQILSSPFASGKTIYQSFYEGGNSESKLLEAQATRKLLEIASQYAQTERVSLNSFLSMIQSTSGKLFRFSPSTGLYENAVTLMSVHAAKGLEFDHVFIIDADESNWKPGNQRYPIPLSLPIHINLDGPADYARLMFVAMTRAKISLNISFVTRIDSKTTALPAEQLATMAFSNSGPTTIQELASSEIAQIVPYRPKAKTMRELLDKTLTNYHLSATALTHFLDLSRGGVDSFIEDNLLRLPGPTSEVLVHGNAMHAAMELAQIQTTNSKLDIDAIKRLYDRKLAEENLTTAVIQRRTGKAHRQIDALFGDLGLRFDPTSKPEQSFSAVTKSGLSMYGKIDRIDTIDDKTLRIVDYKTGTPITNPDSKSQDILLKKWRHKLQLGFYILLMKQQKSYADKKIHAQIIQLDATSSEHLYLDYEFTPEELTKIEQLSQAVYSRIKNLDFPDVSNYDPTLKGITQFEESLLEL